MKCLSDIRMGVRSGHWAVWGAGTDVGGQQLGVLGIVAHLEPTEKTRLPWKEEWPCVDNAKYL